MIKQFTRIGERMEDAILARRLRKAYGKVQALDGLDLQVGRGTIFALLGPNGAGKSTTVKILTTLTRPDSGEATVAGFDVLADPRRVRRAIGVVGQRPGSAEEATGRENLVLQGELYGLTGRELKQRVDAVLERFDLTKTADRPVRMYSGGMQRRLDVAMGLLHSPQVLFLDEPTTGLDPEVRAALWAEIERLARDEQVTILLTTHYLEEADRLASDLAIVDRGRVVAQGSPDALKSELQGDAVHVELAAAESEARIQAVLARVHELTHVSVDGRFVHASATDGATAVPAVLAALETSGVKVASVSMARPSLDEVYLRHAGRTFEEADLRDAA
jgi:ABC-2 type transport system ATP-binding protein